MSDQISTAFFSLETTVKQHFPSLWPQTHAFLAATATLCFHDNPLPITLIISGPGSSGKTEPLIWIMRSGCPHVFRCDNFSPASFVSHASNVKREKLEKIDLLPKIKNKMMCVKELSPIFSGKQDELKSKFAMLTTVLDGEGLVTNSGTQGTRGYQEKINFVWLGATTPPSSQVFNLMAQLGTRLFFFSTDSPLPNAFSYSEVIRGKKSNQVGKESCQLAIAEFLECLFSIHQLRSLSLEQITIPIGTADDMGFLVEALSRLRGCISVGEGQSSDEDRYTTPTIEHGWRAAQVLRALACGSAIIRGHIEVDDVDCAFIRHVVLSSMPEYRRKIFEAILQLGGTNLTAQDVADWAKTAKKTALHRLKELLILGVVNGNLHDEPFRFSLTNDLMSLVPKIYTPPNSVTPEKKPVGYSSKVLTTQNYSVLSVTNNGGVCGDPPNWDDPTSDKWCEQQKKVLIEKFSGK